EYQAQKAILAEVDAGKITREQLFAGAEELMKQRLGKPAAHAPAAAAKPAVAPPPAAAPKISSDVVVN
ncbi:MAG: hypothetical protein DMF88_14940, partial [Acidobacteria bacterium]